jgi:tRNA threonylcarbamoyladenosine biosynthesis protein TsaB
MNHAMTDSPYNLAIETSGPVGSVSLGRADELLAGADLPPQQRHRVDLMPTIDRLCQDRGVTPRQIGEIYLSMGPGSFTGLRIGVATAQMLGTMLGAKLVAVPTLEVVARNARPAADDSGVHIDSSHYPDSHVTSESGTPAGKGWLFTLAPGIEHLLVCLNLKRTAVYGGLFAWSAGQWTLTGEPTVNTLDHFLAQAPRPLAIMGDPLPPFAAEPAVTVLPAEAARPHSGAVWWLGRAAARAGHFVEPQALRPLYAREPEAKELWDRREAIRK